jgi:hypothetical protein
MNNFIIRFNPSQIKKIASRYEYESDDQIINDIIPSVIQNKFFKRNDFLFLCAWKTPRTKPLCLKNSAEFIKAVTSVSLNNQNEKLKIEILLLLAGVSWPTASTLLHFGSNFNYPILDYRAIWSLGINSVPVYNFEFWWSYTKYCRKIARQNRVSLRILDRALWQFSKENQ